MKTKRLAELFQILLKNKKLPTLEYSELIDLKVENEMEKVLREIKVLYWVMGIGFTLLGTLITIFNFLE